ncbi:MAG: hypothetical protein KBF92_06620 [Bacteroidia bacterium]|nr:hypothetical protein [Bacteroidia bacterium]
MKNYLSNILLRLNQFSIDLDKKESFVEITWVTIDEKQNLQKFIFKRNGELILSINGEVTVGKWEYLSTAKCLLIDRIKDKILLNQIFIDTRVMVLKIDGANEDNLLLANEILLPDLNVVGYLKNLFYKKNNIAVGLLKTGESLEIINYEGFFNGNNVTINGELVPDGIFEFENAKKKLLIKNSKISRVNVYANFKTKSENIIIEVEENTPPSKGDFVYTSENILAPDGKYRLNLFNQITVKNGRII